MRVAALLLVSVALVQGAWAVSGGGARVVGGAPDTVWEQPFMAALLYAYEGVTLYQRCGGAVLNQRSVLTSADCLAADAASWRWRVRAGSSFAHSGGTVHSALVILHPAFNPLTLDSDLALVHAAPSLLASGLASPASIAGPNFNVHDGLQVSIIGWGHTAFQGWPSEQMRHALVRVVPLAECRAQFASLGRMVTDNMVCTRSADSTPRGACAGDEGSPLLYYDVVVGVASWGHQCGRAGHASVSTRVSNYVSWIQLNA